MSATATPTPDPNSPAWNIFVDSQSFNVTAIDGTQTTIAFGDVDFLIYEAVTTAIGWAFSLGFASMLAVVLILLTEAKKLRRPIMLLNIASLVLFTMRSIAGLVAIVDPTTIYIGEVFLGAVAQYGNPYGPGIVTGFVQPILYCTIMASFILQVRVVFAVEPQTRLIVTILLSIFAIVIAVFETTYSIYNLIPFFQDNPVTNDPAWLYPAVKIMFLTFMCISSTIFLYKLAMTIRSRRRLGLKKFGPLQILFICSAQCFVVPIIFVALTYTVIPVPNFAVIGQAFIVCSLPLSTLWASADAETSQANRSWGNDRSTTTSTVTIDSAGKNRFAIFSRFKKSSSNKSQLSSYTDDLEKSPSYQGNGIQVSKTLQVESSDIPLGR